MPHRSFLSASHSPAENGVVIDGMTIDSIEFARRGDRLAGKVLILRLTRLTDVLADFGGDLAVEVVGGDDGSGNPCLVLRVVGQLSLSCQRCLKSVVFPVALHAMLRLVEDAEAWGDDADEELDADEPEVIEASRELSVLQLVEDELLLSLPIAPRHEYCALPQGGETVIAASPFAALAQLKKH